MKLVLFEGGGGPIYINITEIVSVRGSLTSNKRTVIYTATRDFEVEGDLTTIMEMVMA